MTSYTKKLYRIDPDAAIQLRRRNYADYRYGKSVTLACFTPAHHNVKPVFGKRVAPPYVGGACAAHCGAPACAQGCVGAPIRNGGTR
jgi:hypothetical protein